MLREALETSRRHSIACLPVLLLSLWWNGVPLFRMLISGVAFVALLLISNLAILYVAHWRQKRASANENV